MDTPLISNLNIIENISLIKEALYNVPTPKAQKEAKEALELVKLENIAQKRPAFCKPIEIFKAQFVRASMLKSAKIAIVTPSKFLIEKDILDVILLLQSSLKLKKDIVIFDLITNRFRYENRGFICHIRE